jgi:hypothetical protein
MKMRPRGFRMASHPHAARIRLFSFDLQLQEDARPAGPNKDKYKFCRSLKRKVARVPIHSN